MATILVVDDRAEIRAVLTAILERSQHTVETANNGQDALDRFRQRPMDIILLDMFMPVMNGFDMLFLLRQEFPEAKVIAVSGGGANMGADALEEARNLGAQFTLQKPIEPAELLAAVQELAPEVPNL